MKVDKAFFATGDMGPKRHYNGYLGKEWEFEKVEEARLMPCQNT